MGNLKISVKDFTKVLYFTDAHNQPSLDLNRFEWLANFINHEKPDYLVDGGDFDDFNSLCTHERNETQKGKLKQSLMRDLEHSVKARGLIDELLTCDPVKHVTLGNHEHRLWLYENNNPEVYGMATGHYLDILKKYDWGFTMYGEYYTVEGVDFTHCPFTGMGKPVGGDNTCKQIAEKSIRDCVYGHTHALQSVIAHKFGPGRSVMAFNGGCFMPDGYIPSYAQNTRKEFWYGAHVIMISKGRIRSIRSYSMQEIEQIFNRKSKRKAK